VEARGLTKPQRRKSDSPKTKQEKRHTIATGSPTKFQQPVTFQTIFVDGELFEQFLQFLTRAGSPLHLPLYVHIRHFLSSNTGRLSPEEARQEAKKIADMIGIGHVTAKENDMKEHLSQETVARITQDLAAEKIPQNIFDNAYRELGNFLTDLFNEFSRKI